MKFDPAIHHRRSIRLQHYDYTQAGAVFVTICTHNRDTLFGDISEGTMVLNNAGNVAEKCRHDITSHFPHVALDESAVMPNHLHGIILITEHVGAKYLSP